MRVEIVIFGITAAIIFNLYTDGKYLKMLPQFKKYYQMAVVGAGGLVIYFMIKQNPLSMGNMLATTNDYLKYMPIDRDTSRWVSPILDFTSKQTFSNTGVLPVQHLSQSERTIMGSGLGQGSSAGAGAGAGGDKRTKRSVSETKKKFVASRQGWKCGECQDQLNAWFEVDHKIRLEHGGSNHVDNLVALCRECHGKKTTIENL